MGWGWLWFAAGWAAGSIYRLLVRHVIRSDDAQHRRWATGREEKGEKGGGGGK